MKNTEISQRDSMPSLVGKTVKMKFRVSCWSYVTNTIRFPWIEEEAGLKNGPEMWKYTLVHPYLTHQCITSENEDVSFNKWMMLRSYWLLFLNLGGGSSRSFIYLQFNPDSKTIPGHVTAMHSMVAFKLLTWQETYTEYIFMTAIKRELNILFFNLMI